MIDTPPLLVVVGMERERRAAAAVGEVIVGARGLTAALGRGASGVISFGLCGALDPGLEPGDIVVGTAVRFVGTVIAADIAWVDRLAERLPEARTGTVAGSSTMVTTAAAKSRLYRQTGAVVVDIESQTVALAAHAAGLRFAVLRVVSDGAERDLPRAAQAGFGEDGKAEISAVLSALARRPWELPALLRVAIEAERGFRVLSRIGGALALSPEVFR